MDAETFLRDHRPALRRGAVDPRRRQVEHDDAVPESIVAEMRDLGLFGLSVPEEYGGIG
jgi:alkylation response protein AidB-like acyl-CoA dehydrogenase